MPDTTKPNLNAEYVVVKHGHEGGDIPDYHEPVWLGQSVVRDRRGRIHRNAWKRFARVICNNPGCSFEALVDAEAIAVMAARTDGSLRHD